MSQRPIDKEAGGAEVLKLLKKLEKLVPDCSDATTAMNSCRERVMRGHGGDRGEFHCSDSMDRLFACVTAQRRAFNTLYAECGKCNNSWWGHRSAAVKSRRELLMNYRECVEKNKPEACLAPVQRFVECAEKVASTMEISQK